MNDLGTIKGEEETALMDLQETRIKIDIFIKVERLNQLQTAKGCISDAMSRFMNSIAMNIFETSSFKSPH